MRGFSVICEAEDTLLRVPDLKPPLPPGESKDLRGDFEEGGENRGLVVEEEEDVDGRLFFAAGEPTVPSSSSSDVFFLLPAPCIYWR